MGLCTDYSKRESLVAERRLTHKDIKQPDQFITFSVQALTWAKSRVMYMLAGTLGVVVIIGLIIGWNVWQAQRQRTAEVLLYEALRPLKTDDRASGGVTAETEKQVLEQLQRLTRDYRATPAAAMAAWHLGHLHYKQGDYTAALTAYEQARQWLPEGHDLFMPRLITLNIGYAQEARGHCDQAITSYEAVAQSAAEWLHGEAFLSIGRCYEKTGAPAKALAAYDQALSKTTISGAIRQQLEDRQAALRPPQTSQSPPSAADTGSSSQASPAGTAEPGR
jgi:predicted negative regulator of RcsB-dependent stress response